MKTVKRAFKFTGAGLLIGLAALFLWKPYLIKVLWFQSPDATTYKHFPQEFMRPADTVFHFIRPAVQRNELDTLRVLNRSDSTVTLKEYLKAGKINAFLVIRNDSVLYERYQNGYTDSTLATTFSVAKSMISVAVGVAVDEGKLRLNDEVTKIIPELKANKAYAGITIEALLSMKSGLKFKGTEGSFLDALFSDEAKYYYTNDMGAYLKNVARDQEPDKVWKYKSIDAILLGWAIQKVTGKTVAQYFDEKIWRKIGTAYPASWGLDHAGGLANTASRFQATAIDLAKIGKLYLQRGYFNNKQVVSGAWIDGSTVLDSTFKGAPKGWHQDVQQRLWWLPKKGENGDFAAEGMRGQMVYADPLTNTIIVQLADKGSGHYPYRKISRYLKGMNFSYGK